MGDRITFFQCVEERWWLTMAAQQEEEAEDARRREDHAERLRGRCDACQEWPDHVLTVSGGLALCDDCEAHGTGATCSTCPGEGSDE